MVKPLFNDCITIMSASPATLNLMRFKTAIWVFGCPPPNPSAPRPWHGYMAKLQLRPTGLPLQGLPSNPSPLPRPCQSYMAKLQPWAQGRCCRACLQTLVRCGTRKPCHISIGSNAFQNCHLGVLPTLPLPRPAARPSLKALRSRGHGKATAVNGQV